jgi:hypothetical protein
MKHSRLAILAVAALVVVAGCSADVATQLTSNEQVRTQVFDAIAANPQLSGALVDKLMSADSTRIGTVDKMLANDEVAKQVIVRVAMSKDAMDLVIGAAVRDSAMRVHVITLLKGVEMASKQKR